MIRIPIRSAAPQALEWLLLPDPPVLLHVFDRSCTLMRGAGPVSIVNPELGSGPFNLVLESAFDFSLLDADARVEAMDGGIRIGRWRFDPAAASIWDPRPFWEDVSAADAAWALPLLAAQAGAFAVRPGLDIAALPDPDDLPAMVDFAHRLAGRGPGLTPSGDDFLMGVMHALWLRPGADGAGVVCEAIARAAAPRTTTLSAAWLRAAAAGSAGEAWHGLVRAIAQRDPAALGNSAGAILATGHSSGADALAGFLAGLDQLSQH